MSDEEEKQHCFCTGMTAHSYNANRHEQDGSGKRLGRFFGQLRKQKFCPAVLFYAMGLWLAWEAREILSDLLILPAWVTPLIVLLGILGLPLMTILIWRCAKRQGNRPGHDTAGEDRSDLALDLVLLAAALAICATLAAYSWQSAPAGPGEDTAERSPIERITTKTIEHSMAHLHS